MLSTLRPVHLLVEKLMVAEALSMDMRARCKKNHRFGACSAVQECWEWGSVTVLGG